MYGGLIESIKKKKEFSYLEDDFVLKVLKIYFKSNSVPSNNKRSALYKLTVKNVRKILREVFGVFQPVDDLKRLELLDELNSLKDLDMHREILSRHISTRERLDFYDRLYSRIFDITGKPKSILDLACGINPISFPFMDVKVKLICYELSKLDCDLLNGYFNKFGIYGKVVCGDLLSVKKFPKVDVVFLFKTLDSLEILSKNSSLELLNKLNCKWIVVSFATKSLGGRKKISKRVWFEKLLKKLKYRYEVLDFDNERFYVVRKK